MKSSQSTDYFGDDQEDFKDALMLLDVTTAEGNAEAHPGTPAKELPQKRKHEETDTAIEQEDDINLHILAKMRQRDDKNDIYGASSFGDYGEYMSRKRAKLQIQNANMAELKSTIFEGIEIYINGRVEPSLQELREMIVEHGGVFHAYLTKKSLVTHVIAMNLTPAKVKEFARMKVARPAWIVESVKAGYLLPWKEFKLVIDDRTDAAQGKRGGQTLLRPIQGPQTPILTTAQPTAEPASPSSPIKDPIYMTDPVTMEQAARIPSYALNKSNTAAQRLIAQPGWREENTAVSGTKFIDKYYENSRLHHLSMWKAELKDLVSRARERNENGNEPSPGHSEAPVMTKPMGHGVSMKGAELLKTWEGPSPTKKGKETGDPIVQRVYMHCDFDSFFVAAGLLARPGLRGKPVVVCHSQGSGEGAASTSEIASSSYEARAAGIHNGMSLGQARQLCPEVVTLPYEFERYKELSLKFYTVLLSFTDELQAVSVDEALLDVSHAVANLKIQTLSQDPSAIAVDFAQVLAEQIRARLLEVTSCQISIGIGENLLLARIASRKAKPAGSYHLALSDAPSFLAPLPLDMIWGVGYATKKKAEEKLNINTIGDLQLHSKPSLVKVFGPAMGEKLYKAAKGSDDSKLQPDQKRKSVSAEINFGIRFEKNDQAALFMQKLGQEVASRLKAVEMKGRLLTLKVMKRHPDAPVEAPKFMGHGICEQFSKSAPLADPSSGGGATNDGDIIGEVAWQLLDSLKFDPQQLRGLGLQVTKLEGKDGPITETEEKRESGQRRLNFQSTSPSKTVKSPGGHSSRKQGSEDAKGSHSGMEYKEPTLDTLDPAILDELPRDIREEILGLLRESANGGAGTSSGKSRPFDPGSTLIEDDSVVEMSAPPPSHKAETPKPKSHASGDPVSSTSKTPSKSTGDITSQLHPKTKTVISPTKSVLFSKPRGAFQPSKEELEELGLDAEVFFFLPKDLQREQLTHERENARKNRNVGVTGLKTGGFGPGRVGFTRSPSAGPQFGRGDFKLEAKFPETVPLNLAVRPDATDQRSTSTGKGRGRIEPPTSLVNLGDIQAHLKRWVVASHKGQLEPADADIEGLRSWLLRCMKEEGIEKPTIVLKWWRELLCGYWGEKDAKALKKDGKKVNVGNEERLSEVWWGAFWESKAQMDAIVNGMVGGKLSLR